MKPEHLIIAALSAIFLASCDKPSPTIEQSVVCNLTVHTFNDIDGISRMMSDVYCYNADVSITFDTIDVSGIRPGLYWDYSLDNSTPPQFLEGYSTDTSRHTLQVTFGKHQLIIRYRFTRYPEVYRFYVRNINIISDTLICDTLRVTDFMTDEDFYADAH